MIKAIIFDCFGVLVENSFDAFVEEYLDDESKREEAREADHLATQGALTWAQNVEILSKLSGISPEEVNKSLDRNPANRELLDFIRVELKPQYKIGFLSNAADDWMEDLFSAEEIALFDDIVLSYQHKMNKPSKEIFDLASQRLGVLPEECLFIDDVGRYCEGARAAGMKAIQFTDTDSCIGAIRSELT